jgi:hypothetical protein
MTSQKTDTEIWLLNHRMSFSVHLTKQEILHRLFSVDGILHEFGIFEDEEFAVFWFHPYDCLVIHTILMMSLPFSILDMNTILIHIRIQQWA